MLERGSVLVAAPRGAFQVILAAPRGNLEALQPRALVVLGVKAQLRDGEYRAAVLEVRLFGLTDSVRSGSFPRKS